MKELEISRKKWGRGTGNGSLLDADTNLMCCLGFYCRSVGLRKKDITDRQMPDEVRRLLPKQAKWLLDEFECISDDARDLAETNDEERLPDKKREKKIKKIFAEHGVKVKFVP